jgi:outer membrane protein assembly factor BamB
LDIPVEADKVIWQARVPGSVARHMTLTPISGKPTLVVPWSYQSRWGDITHIEGGVTLFSLEDGGELWTARVEMPVEGGVSCVHFRTEEEQLSQSGKERPAGLILVAAGIGGVAGGEGAVVALDLQSGEEQWRVRLNGAARGAPVVEQNRLYVASDNGVLVCLDIRNGNPVWNEPLRLFERPVPVPASPAIVHHGANTHTLVVATYGAGFGRIDGKVLAIREGRILWERSVPGNVRDTPLIVGERVFVASYNNTPNQGVLQAFDLRTGEPVWEQPFVVQGQPSRRHSYFFSATPLYHAGKLYLGNLNHFIYALDAESGELIWAVDAAANGIATTPLWMEGLLLFGANDGKVYALEVEGRTRLSTYDMGAPVLTNILSEEEVLFVGSQNGLVAALPWHLGRYDWMAKYFIDSQRFSQAGESSALAGFFENETERSRNFYHQAIQCWEKSGEFEKSAQLWLALGDEKQAAQAYYQAGQHWQHRQPHLASRFFAYAGELFFKLHQAASLNRCNRQWALCEGWPYVRMDISNLGTLIAWEPGEVTLRLIQEGKVNLPGGLKLYIGGSLKSRLEAEIRVPFEPGQVWNVPLTIVPSDQQSVLEVEVEYVVDIASGQIMRSMLSVPLRVTRKPLQIGDVGKMDLHIYIPQATTEGVNIITEDVGMLRADNAANEVHIRGSVGAVKKKSKSRKIQIDGDVGLYREEE